MQPTRVIGAQGAGRPTLNFAPAAFGSLAARIDLADMDNTSTSSEWGNAAEATTDATSLAGVRDELSSNKAVVSQDIEMGRYVTTLTGTWQADETPASAPLL